MMSANPLSFRLTTTAFALATIAAFGLQLRAQETNDTPKAAYVDDWTHHHMVFSNPGTREDAVKRGELGKWQKITNDPRYKMQQIKRSLGNLPVVPDPDRAGGGDNSWDGHGDHRGGGGGGGTASNGVKKDWSVNLGNGEATQTGTFTGNPTSGQTVTIGGSEVLTASGAQATASITIAGTYCFAPGTGVNVNGTNFTTNATQGTGTYTVTALPSSGSTVTIGGTTYTFESPGLGFIFGPSNTVLIGSGGSTAQNLQYTAQNLSVAINNGGTCGSTYLGGCTNNVGVANAEVTSTNTGGTATETMTAICAGNAAITNSGTTGVTVNNIAAGNAGTTSGPGQTFAIGASNTATATNIYTDITTNATTEGLVTATNPSGAVDLTAIVWGTGGNAYTLTDNATSGVTLSGAKFSGGVAQTNTGTNFALDGVLADDATNLAAAIARNGGGVGVTATSSGAVVDVTATTGGTGGNNTTLASGLSNFSWAGAKLAGGITAAVQPNAFPAKFGSSLTAASCANDFVVYPTGQAGAPGAANIIAYNEIYVGAGCTTPNPTVYWAYNTAGSGEPDSVTTSPIMSPYGDQVAYIQSNGTYASLVLLRWKKNSNDTMTAPETLTSAGTGNYRSCTTPCMVSIELNGSADDTYSAPYYDWTTDTLYVGDDSGKLHKFTGVFYGTPTENVTSPWPRAVSTHALSSPVYDTTSQRVFVGDMSGTLWSVPSGSTGTTYNTGVIGDTVADAPLIDGAQQTVYGFFTTSVAYSEQNYNAIFQFSTGFTGLGSPGVVAIAAAGGTAGSGYYLYAGAFDNVFYQSSGGTGNLYVVGNTEQTTSGGILYRVGIGGGSLTGTVTAVGTVTANGHPWPSPVTEFCNGACTTTTGGTCGVGVTCTNSGTDYVFFSVNRGNVGTCTSTAGNGCIMSYNVSNPSSITLAGTQNYTTVGTTGCWTTGGIVIDNSAATTGASQIYFVGLAGNTAGAANSNGPTSSACTTGSSNTIQAIQAAQAAP